MATENPAEELARLRQENAALREKAESLEEENRLLKAILYGKSSEKNKADPGEGPQQMQFQFDEGDLAPPVQTSSPPQVPVKEHTREKRKRLNKRIFNPG